MHFTVRLTDLFQGHWNQLTRSDDHFQSSSLISDSLGPSGVRDGNRSDMDLKLISKW